MLWLVPVPLQGWVLCLCTSALCCHHPLQGRAWHTGGTSSTGQLWAPQSWLLLLCSGSASRDVGEVKAKQVLRSEAALAEVLLVPHAVPSQVWDSKRSHGRRSGLGEQEPRREKPHRCHRAPVPCRDGQWMKTPIFGLFVLQGLKSWAPSDAEPLLLSPRLQGWSHIPSTAPWLQSHPRFPSWQQWSAGHKSGQGSGKFGVEFLVGKDQLKCSHYN